MKIEKQFTVILATAVVGLLIASSVLPPVRGAYAQRAVLQTEAKATGSFDVRAFGAKGDGKALDTPAVNKAIDAAAAAGGGTVHFSAGTYRCFSIHLKSNVALYLDQGATILAADPSDKDGQYDAPEPNQWDQYQDFGHSHWHNSLIWGENLENIRVWCEAARSRARSNRMMHWATLPLIPGADHLVIRTLATRLSPVGGTNRSVLSFAATYSFAMSRSYTVVILRFLQLVLIT